MNLALQYPIFGPEIHCPHCHQRIAALTLTDSYLCPRHGAFEADPQMGELIHLQSQRHWRLWQDKWYRQYTHPDGIRFEIHEALDQLYTEGYRATKIIIAYRYRKLVSTCLEGNSSWKEDPNSKNLQLYGVPVEFSAEPPEDPCWEVINFHLEREKGTPQHCTYYRLFE